MPSKLVPAGQAQVLLTSAYGATQPLHMPVYVHQEQCAMELGSLRAHSGRGVSALPCVRVPACAVGSHRPQPALPAEAGANASLFGRVSGIMRAR